MVILLRHQCMTDGQTSRHSKERRDLYINLASLSTWGTANVLFVQKSLGTKRENSSFYSDGTLSENI